MRPSLFNLSLHLSESDFRGFGFFSASAHSIRTKLRKSDLGVLSMKYSLSTLSKCNLKKPIQSAQRCYPVGSVKTSYKQQAPLPLRVHQIAQFQLHHYQTGHMKSVNRQLTSWAHESFPVATKLPQKFEVLVPRNHAESLQEICGVVMSTIGGLDDLESSLNQLIVSLTSSHISQIIDFCKQEAPTRRLLRFFLWSHNKLKDALKDEDFNHAIRVVAEKNDHTAMDILLSELMKNGRVMEMKTFSLVVEVLVKLGKEDEALGIFKNLDNFKCPQNSESVSAIVHALCAKGHTKRAQGVVWHHKDKKSGIELSIYKSLLYGWTTQQNVKEARKLLQEMKSLGFIPDLFCYNTFLRCLCQKNLRRNPSGLVPEALNVMMEMRSYKISPNSVSYNILLSCLGKARRVKESCDILEKMKMSGCGRDWMSYYLVARVLYLTGRFGKGNKIVGEMIEEGLVPNRKFYYDLIGLLCGVERVNFALELFETMKRSSLGGYGPIYDVLIPKLCRGGDFDKGRELWDEAMALGVTLHCSTDVLDPSITEVFKPARKVQEDVRLEACRKAKKKKVNGPS